MNLKSRNYAIAQTVLLCRFGGIFFLNVGFRAFPPGEGRSRGHCTAILIIVAGLFLRKPTVPVAIAAAVVAAFLVVKVRFEEKLLLARYHEYAEYKSRT